MEVPPLAKYHPFEASSVARGGYLCYQAVQTFIAVRVIVPRVALPPDIFREMAEGVVLRQGPDPCIDCQLAVKRRVPFQFVTQVGRHETLMCIRSVSEHMAPFLQCDSGVQQCLGIATTRMHFADMPRQKVDSKKEEVFGLGRFAVNCRRSSTPNHSSRDRAHTSN